MSFQSTTKLGVLNYINPIVAPSDPKDFLFVKLGDTSQGIQALLVGRPKKIQNGRFSTFRIETDGFELLQGIPRPEYDVLHQNRSRYFALRSLMVPLAVKIVRDRFGLKPYYAHFPPPLLRRSNQKLDTRDHGSGETPHAMVHNDYGFDTFHRMKNSNNYYNAIANPDKRENIRKQYQKVGRVIVVQFWMSAQPEGTIIENDRLALCHPRSIRTTDLVSRLATSYGGFASEFAILQAKDSPAHEWFYWPDMKTDESLVWMGYDSEWRDEMKPCFHTSFHDASILNGMPRESVECRVILLFEEKISSRL